MPGLQVSKFDRACAGHNVVPNSNGLWRGLHLLQGYHHWVYPLNVGKLQYHSDTIASEKTTRHLTARRGLHGRAAPLPRPAALSHCATLARRSRSAPTTWTAATAAQRLVKMVSIGRRDSIVLQSIHLDGAVLVPLVLLAMHAGAAILQEYLLFMMARVQPACHQYHCHSDCSVFYCAQAARQSINCCIGMRASRRLQALPRGTPVRSLYVRC